MKSMDFAARLRADPPPHSMCGKGLQRRMAAKDAISCGRTYETAPKDSRQNKALLKFEWVALTLLS
jgi:hypothetical protein